MSHEKILGGVEDSERSQKVETEKR